MYGQCNARSVVIFPDTVHYCPLTGTKSYYLETKLQGCKQLVLSHNYAADDPQPRVEPNNLLITNLMKLFIPAAFSLQNSTVCVLTSSFGSAHVTNLFTKYDTSTT